MRTLEPPATAPTGTTPVATDPAAPSVQAEPAGAAEAATPEIAGLWNPAGMRTVPAVCPVCQRTPREPHARGKDFEYGATGPTEWSLVRCSGCDVILLSPRPADDEIGRVYPEDYYAHGSGGAPTVGQRVKIALDRRAARRYLDVAGPAVADQPILDVGCGDGRLLSLFEQIGVERTLLHGVEISTHSAAAAQARGYTVHAGRFETLNLRPCFFGLVIMQQVIEHVTDPRAVLNQLYQSLLPGGALILETPNIASWDHALFRSRYWGGYHIPRHFTLFSPRSLRRLLSYTGFEVVRVESLLSPSFWIQSLHHFAAERGAGAALRGFLHPQRPGPLPLSFFSALDVAGKALGITSNMRVIARKR